MKRDVSLASTQHLQMEACSRRVPAKICMTNQHLIGLAKQPRLGIIALRSWQDLPQNSLGECTDSYFNREISKI